MQLEKRALTPKIEVKECDAREIADWINKDLDPLGPLGSMIRACRGWVRRYKEIRIFHMYHEQNIVIDGLTKDHHQQML